MRNYDFSLSGRLAEQRECNLGVLVPIPVSERVETLAELLYQEGHGRVPRKELVAAVLNAAPEDPVELAKLLQNYRTARVRDALIEQPESGNVVRFPRRPPGPRARLGN